MMGLTNIIRLMSVSPRGKVVDASLATDHTAPQPHGADKARRDKTQTQTPSKAHPQDNATPVPGWPLMLLASHEDQFLYTQEASRKDPGAEVSPKEPRRDRKDDAASPLPPGMMCEDDGNDKDSSIFSVSLTEASLSSRTCDESLSNGEEYEASATCPTPRPASPERAARGLEHLEDEGGSPPPQTDESPKDPAALPAVVVGDVIWVPLSGLGSSQQGGSATRENPPVHTETSAVSHRADPFAAFLRSVASGEDQDSPSPEGTKALAEHSVESDPGKAGKGAETAEMCMEAGSWDDAVAYCGTPLPHGTPLQGSKGSFSEVREPLSPAQGRRIFPEQEEVVGERGAREGPKRGGQGGSEGGSSSGEETCIRWGRDETEERSESEVNGEEGEGVSLKLHTASGDMGVTVIGQEKGTPSSQAALAPFPSAQGGAVSRHPENGSPADGVEEWDEGLNLEPRNWLLQTRLPQRRLPQMCLPLLLAQCLGSPVTGRPGQGTWGEKWRGQETGREREKDKLTEQGGVEGEADHAKEEEKQGEEEGDREQGSVVPGAERRGGREGESCSCAGAIRKGLLHVSASHTPAMKSDFRLESSQAGGTVGVDGACLELGETLKTELETSNADSNSALRRTNHLNTAGFSPQPSTTNGMPTQTTAAGDNPHKALFLFATALWMEKHASCASVGGEEPLGRGTLT